MEQLTATQTNPGEWVFTWTPSPSSVYEIWLSGVLLGTTGAGVGTYTVGPPGPTDAPPSIEVHDTSTGDAQSKKYPPTLLLQWYRVPNAAGYRVERKINESWIVVSDTVERGAGWYIYRSGVLVDEAQEQFRVKVLDARGVSGASVDFTTKITTTPVTPQTDLVVTGGNLEVRLQS